MQPAIVSPAARDAIAGHLAGLGLPPESRKGLLDAMERGMALGEDDAFALRDRLVAQATESLSIALAAAVDGVADAVIHPIENRGEGA